MKGARHILMIDDSTAEAGLVKQALDMCGIEASFDHIMRASNAVPYLNGLSFLPLDSKPDLVILDLHMPDVSGLELLRIIKDNEELKLMPVVMFSTSRTDEDIMESYSGRANAYIVKPYEFEGYMDVMRNLCDFWFDTVKLPDDPDVY